MFSRVYPSQAAGPDSIQYARQHRDPYTRVLVVDYSSAFNTIISNIMVSKLSILGLHPLIRFWIKDFLTNRPQTVKLGPHLSSTEHRLPTGMCAEPTTLHPPQCGPAHTSNAIMKVADDTTVVWLICGDDESAYRDEIQNPKCVVLG